MLTKSAYQKCLAHTLLVAFGQNRTLSNIYIYIFYVFCLF